MAYCEINSGLLINSSMLELWFESHECVSIYDYLLVGHINILYTTCLNSITGKHIMYKDVAICLCYFFFFFFLIQFYVPFKLFHSYRDGSIGRWGENRSTRGKTT